MLGKIIPILGLVVGVGAGAGAGLFLAPAPAPEHDAAETHEEGGENHHGGDHAPASKKKDSKASADNSHDDGHGATDGAALEYVKLNNQFVVPLVNDERITGLVVMSLSLEAPAGSTQSIYTKEPKLRDAFLRVLFDHANIGGFDGNFTNSNTMAILRTALRETANNVLHIPVMDVLILDIARQDV